MVAILSGIAALIAGLSRAGLRAAVEGAPLTSTLGGVAVSALAAAILGYPVYFIFRLASDRFRVRNDTLFR